MLIMICNIGSTSFKFQILDMNTEHQLARGYTERVGNKDAIINYFIGDNKAFDSIENIPTHREAVKHCLDFLASEKSGLINNLTELDGIGFKTIQAGDKNGSIILMHDGDSINENANRSAVVEALPQIIDYLECKGYEFVTIPELLNIKET